MGVSKDLPSGDPIAGSEPDPVIEAFAKRARTKKKLLMQNEVDQPAGYLDYETHFWTSKSVFANLDMDQEYPNHLNLSGSDDHIMILDSDYSPTSQICFPVSDSDSMIQWMWSGLMGNLLNPMDLNLTQKSIQHWVILTWNWTLPFLITSFCQMIFPDQRTTELSLGGSGVMAGFKRDPNTGNFTAALFAHFPDDLVD